MAHISRTILLRAACAALAITAVGAGASLPGTPRPARAAVPATCQPSQLALATAGSNSGAGHIGIGFRLRNRSARTCTLYGYPGALMLDARGRALPTTIVRGYGYLAGARGPRTVYLAPGGSAYTFLEYVHFPTPGQRCYTSSALLMTPPNDYGTLRVPVALVDVCGGILRAAPVAAIPYF